MAGAMVSASTGAMNSLLGKLATLMGKEYSKLKGVRKEVASLQDEFNSMKALLDKLADMDELDIQAKEWRNQVKDMSYDIEDCIDDFMHHIGKNVVTTGFVKKTAQLLKNLRVRHQIASKIQEIKIRVKDANERHMRYKLDECTPKPSCVPIDPRVAAIHTEAANLVGIDVPREELAKLLMGEEQVLKVVSVVGFAGLGKTTLANQVYCKLEGQFECKAFVSVSQKPDIPKLLNKILSKIGGHFSHIDELDDLENIKKHLKDKRYFIVIDDLWDLSAWKIIKCAFPENNFGSRVLITARIYDVALSCCSYRQQYVYNMRPLDKENSRRLFFSIIFDSSQSCPDAYEDLSTDILKKCGGLPLAIISIASLLAGQPNSKWEYVQNSLGSMFQGNPNLGDMMQILDLSYKSLPNHLKTCLLYIGMYPEDHIIQKDDLLRQWIAEGFVISKVCGLDVEDVAENYFNELINTSIIQPVDTNYTGEVLSCRIHDLMLDLIRVKCAEENFIHVVDGSQAVTGLHKKTRRVSLQYHGAGSTLDLPHELWGLEYLETLVLNVEKGTISVPSDVAHLCRLLHLIVPSGVSFADRIVSFKSLRTLGAFDVSTSSMDSIMSLGELTNLRDLQILCSSFPVTHVVEEALRSSLERLSCSSSLNLNKLVLSVPRFPCTLFGHEWSILSRFSAHLQSLNLKEMLFSSVPKWIGQLHGLHDLNLWVREVLLKDDDISILAGLPSLVHLSLHVQQCSKQRIIIPGHGVKFPVLKSLKLYCPKLLPVFEEGAMPKLHRLRLVLEVVNQGPDDLTKWELGPSMDMGHLPADVKEIKIGMSWSLRKSISRWNVDAAQSAMRSAFSWRHPGVRLIFR
ncbi:unnamed protein product [Urochloa decumbens]|uniref:Uncharacterized protein n=1 Tax=Urochloa decumbens TaxID=240449 RepID=A0ABC8WKH1_9POAL